jgi:putative transcriptional regulator
MRDHWFERTLILLCQHNEEGALGIVINREGPVTITEVLERLREEHDLADTNEDAERILWGGPVGEGAGFIVWNGRVDDAEGWNVGSQVAVSPSVERLATLLKDEQGFALCLGYAGWGPGQLDEEIERGSWLAVDVDPAIIFSTPLDQRYDRALGLLGLTANTVWMTPINE